VELGSRSCGGDGDPQGLGVRGAEATHIRVYSTHPRTVWGVTPAADHPPARHASRGQVDVSAAHARTTVWPPGFHPRLTPPDAQDGVVGRCSPPVRRAHYQPSAKPSRECNGKPRCKRVYTCSNLTCTRSHPPTSSCAVYRAATDPPLPCPESQCRPRRCEKQRHWWCVLPRWLVATPLRA